jgi:two-component system, chemotaxis family, chemotaxis protein CheY
MRRVQVLIADDNAQARQIVRTIVAGLDADVCECVDGSSAIDACMAWRPDLALVDCEMRPMDGIRFTELVRAGATPLPRNLPIVMMTGHADQAHVIRARDAGVSGFIAKPLSVGAVISQIQRMLSAPPLHRIKTSAASGFGL